MKYLERQKRLTAICLSPLYRESIEPLKQEENEIGSTETSLIVRSILADCFTEWQIDVMVSPDSMEMQKRFRL